jgi:hypothetical protein
MDKQKENRKIITKRYRDKKRNYINNLEKENLRLKEIIKNLEIQLFGINNLLSRSLFLPTPVILGKKNI